MKKLIGEKITGTAVWDIKSAKDSGKVFEDTTVLGDDNGKEVAIPKNFKVAQDSNTVVDEGIIITDGTNEFVWVPVDDPSTMFIEETVKLNGVTTTTNIYSKLRVRSGESYTAGKPGETNKVREPDVLSSDDTDVKSTMIYGCQWDGTMSWLSKNGYNTDTDSSSWGNYSGSPINTACQNVNKYRL